MTGETDIETRVGRAVEQALGVSAARVERLAYGEVNRVFRVETASGVFVVKVFTHAGWPEPGKLEWVEAQLARRAVPHARLLHHTRAADLFPHGFAVSESAGARNCRQAIDDGRLSFDDYFTLAGRHLRRVHDIGVPRFGYLGGGTGTDDDFVGWLLDCTVKDRLAEVTDGSLPAGLYARIERRVESLLRPLAARFRPVLLHGDAQPCNALLDAAGRLVLVDWDEAFAGPWPWDYTRLSYWYSYTRAAGAAEARRLREAFLRGYGPVEFGPRELDAVELAFHTAYAADLLAYCHQTGRAEQFARTRELLLRLLD